MSCQLHKGNYDAALSERQKAVQVLSEVRRQRMQDRDEIQWRGAVKRMLIEQRNKVLARLDELSIPDIILDEMPKLITQGDLEDVYINLYTTQGEKYYEWAQDNVKQRGIYHRRKRLDPSDPYFNQMADFVQSQVATRIVTITQTTRKAAELAISRAIEQGIADGLGFVATKRLVEQAVKDEWRVQASFRPARIARTEVGTVFNHASYSGAINTGVEFMKSWMVTRDGRERATHEIAGSQPPIEKNAKFLVGGSEMLYPNDPSGSAAEVINCRCATAFVTDF